MNRSARMLVKKLMERVTRRAHTDFGPAMRSRVDNNLAVLLHETCYKNYAPCLAGAGRFGRIPHPVVPADIQESYGCRAFRRISRTGRKLFGPVRRNDARKCKSRRIRGAER